MDLYEEAVKLLKKAIPIFKDEGETTDDIKGAFDSASKMLGLLPISEKEKETLIKALKDVKKDVK